MVVIAIRKVRVGIFLQATTTIKAGATRTSIDIHLQQDDQERMIRLTYLVDCSPGWQKISVLDGMIWVLECGGAAGPVTVVAWCVHAPLRCVDCCTVGLGMRAWCAHFSCNWWNR